MIGTPGAAAGRAHRRRCWPSGAAPRADPLPAAAGSTPPPAGRPLDGITVVEFATIIAAPMATSMLADLGARVIKIEPIDGDPYRHLIAGGTPGGQDDRRQDVDLHRPEEGRGSADRPRARSPAPTSSCTTARPGVADRLGLGEAELRADNPDLIWVSVTGYGRHSPSAARPATHPCAGAASGGAGYQAGAALDAPCDTLDDVREISRQLMRANESNPDPNTGVVAAAAALLALLARERFGVGQAVYVNMLAANMYANADDVLAYAGKPPRSLVRRRAVRLRRRLPPVPHRRRLAVPGRHHRRRVAPGAGGARALDLVDDARFADDAARADARRAGRRARPSGWPRRAAAEWEAALRRRRRRRRAGRRVDARACSSPTTSRCWPTTSPRSAPTPASAPTAAGDRSSSSTVASAPTRPGRARRRADRRDPRRDRSLARRDRRAARRPGGRQRAGRLDLTGY